MNTKLNVHLVRALVFALVLFAVVAGAAGQQEPAQGRVPARVLTNAAHGQLSSVGFFERLFGFGGRSGSTGGDGQNPTSPGRSQSPSDKTFSTLQPNESLIGGIHRSTPAKRAAALRLAEKGRQFIMRKQHRYAVNMLEKALGLEASPYVYYYLSRAHYNLGNYSQSANFLDVAASLLGPRPEWASEVAALRAQYPEAPANGGERRINRVAAVRSAGTGGHAGMKAPDL